MTWYPPSQPPRHVDVQAHAWFREALEELETTEGLLKAATAIARHSLKDANPQRVLEQLQEIAEQVRIKVRNPTPQALLANLHDVLFEQMEFRGNSQEYYNPRNSFLPSVLETRQGIPITLTLVYKGVAEFLSLPVRGLNCPGHFLAELVLPGERAIIDAYHGGALLSREEAITRVEGVFGRRLPNSEFWLLPASHAAWIHRILLNLQNSYSMQQNEPEMAAMRELELLLPP